VLEAFSLKVYPRIRQYTRRPIALAKLFFYNRKTNRKTKGKREEGKNLSLLYGLGNMV
jgi:hypothetical protein